MANRRIPPHQVLLGVLLFSLCFHAGRPALACDSGSEQPAKSKARGR